MDQKIQQLTVSQKKNLIKADSALSDLFKEKSERPLSKARGEDVDNFLNTLSESELQVILAQINSMSEEKPEAVEKESNGNGKKAEVEASDEPQEEKEIPEGTLQKIFKDLYPTSLHKTKYIQENPSLKMAALTKGLLGKNPKKEAVDNFLVKQVQKNPKSLKQLTLDWLESKKSLKIDVLKLADKNLKVADIEAMVKEVSIEDLGTYCYLMQGEINHQAFNHIESIRKQEAQKKVESGEFESEQVKGLEKKLRQAEIKIEELEEKQKDEINSLRLNYDAEREKMKSKYEQRMDSLKGKYEEEKNQLVKIQADSDRRFAEERKTFDDQVHKYKAENEKLIERLNNTSSDLLSQSKQYKDSNKELTRLQNRVDELQSDNKELTSKNEELKYANETLTNEIEQLKQHDNSLQIKLQDLALKIQELEMMKIAFLLRESEVREVIKELNAVDETKQRIFQLLNIDTRQNQYEEEAEFETLADLWVELIKQEEDIMADYLSIGAQEVTGKEALKEKIDSLLDLDYNLKAREVLVKLLYEKGYKAYRSID